MSKVESKLKNYLEEGRERVDEKREEKLIDSNALEVRYDKSDNTYFVLVKDRNYVKLVIKK